MNTIYFNFMKRKLAFKWNKKRHQIALTGQVEKKTNTLVVAAKHELAETMCYPFYWYEKELNEKLGLYFQEILTEALLEEANKSEHSKTANTIASANIKRIFYQPNFEMPEAEMVKTLTFLHERFPNAKIAFMDWFAPLHIRPSAIADPFIDLYLKKQTYRDYNRYSLPTLGDTNLSDYYGRKHQLKEEIMQFTPPLDMESKIRLWTNFGFSPQMVDAFLGPLKNRPGTKTIDMHARLAVNGAPWYKAMRQEAKDAVMDLSGRGLNIVSEGRVKRYRFFEEMSKSKMCFSPFGYGEVCWRDYEAFATGALLFKPNMDHLEVFPDIFIPDETYVSLEWDLSDFREKVMEYHKNDKEVMRITQNAFEIMRDSIKGNAFLNHVEGIFNL